MGAPKFPNILGGARDRSAEQICEALGVDRSTLKRWVSQGLPWESHRDRKKWFCEDEVRAWLESKGLSGKVGRPQTPEGKDMAGAKLRKELALASLREFEVGLRKGELVKRVDVDRENVRKVAALRDSLLALPGALAPTLEGLDEAEIRLKLENGMKAALEQFSKGCST